ncbi:FMN-binding protein [Novipirellula sp.]|uniref:FMN-binding protein n=1 Tax=Novipirellula sp. TaxID=2795430 RepID=UPI00356811E4
MKTSISTDPTLSGLASTPRPQTASIYGVVLSVGIVCSLAIVTVYQLTGPRILRNQVAMRHDAILVVLPDAVTVIPFEFDSTLGQFHPAATDDADSDAVFAGFNPGGELVGLAIETKGMGYQDTIRLMYGYSPHEQAIIGIRVLESRETPGLGDRIETDANFLSHFRRLDVSLESTSNQLAHPIEFVKSGNKTAPWQIDGITGATISSRATAAMIGDSAADWIPRVYPRLADFTATSQETR